MATSLVTFSGTLSSTNSTPGKGDEVVLQAGAEVEFGQFKFLAQHQIHLADVLAIGSDHFHVFGDLRGVRLFNHLPDFDAPRL